MDWQKIRYELSIKSEKFRDFGHNDKIAKNVRNDLLKTFNYTCRHCGGVYHKYMICTYIPDCKSNDILCRLCYLITHLNYGVYKELKVYYSHLSQIDIIRKTVDLIIENDRIPTPLEIDPNILQVPISILEYINIINNYDEPVEYLKNYKIFFSQRLDINFIITNYGNNMITFIDNDNQGTTDTDVEKIKIKKYKPTSEEILFFEKHFNQKSLND